MDETPQNTRTAETRRRILESAAACFAKYGFQRTRVDDVAEGAGVSRALVYGYFESKPNLLHCVQRQALEERLEANEAAVEAAPDARAAIAAWLEANLLDSEPITLARAVFSADPDTRWEGVGTEFRDRWLARLREILRQGVADGELRSELDVEATATALRAVLLGMTQQLYAEPRPALPSAERAIRAAVELVLAGLAPTDRRDTP